MSWKVFDFECVACGYIFEETVNNDPEEIPCASCNEPAVRLMGAPLLGQMNDPAKRKETLMKRSTDHTRKERKAGHLPNIDNYAEFRGKKL